LTYIKHSETVFIMTRLLLILCLILSFQTLARTDDISEFEIEGISINDSALNYFSIEQINDNMSMPPNLEKSAYTQSCFNNYGKIYDRICLAFNKNSFEKKIVQIQAQIRYDKDVINICKKKQTEIDEELSLIFKNLKRKDWGRRLLTGWGDTNIESYYYPITYEFADNSKAQLGCYSIMNKLFLKVAVYTSEFAEVISD